MSKNVDWTVPALILVLAQHSAALIISNLVGYQQRPPTLSYLLIAFVLSSIGGLVLLLRHLWRLWRAGERNPISRLRADMPIVAIATYFLGFQLVGMQMAALTWLKEMLPLAVPFWADGLLVGFDRAILGTDAWRVIPEALVRPLDALYPVWAMVKFIVVVLILISAPSRMKSQAMLSYFLTVGLVGVSGQYLLSSVGPIFYDRLVHANEFGALAARLQAHAPIAHAASEYLWQSYLDGGDGIGRGISAMPSMHVAITTWAAIVMGQFWPKTKWPLWAFWLVILTGSIGLGWHYLSDGLVGAGGALICWRLAPALLTWSYKPKGAIEGSAAT